MMFIYKAKAELVGTRKKWKDGVYIKGADHKWHREMIHQHAVDHLKAMGKHDHKELVSNFKEAVSGYVDHLHKNDIHPSSAHHIRTDKKYWDKYFEADDWHEDKSCLKFSKEAIKVAKKFHKELTAKKKAEAKEKPVREKKPLKKKIPAKKEVKKEVKKESKKKEAKEKVAVKRKERSSSFSFEHEIDYQKALRSIASRKYTYEKAKFFFDGMTVKDRKEAKKLFGVTIEMGGVQGIVTGLRVVRTIYDKRGEGSVVEYELLTESGLEKMVDVGKIKVIPDPTGPESQTARSLPESLKKIGMQDIIYDKKISKNNQEHWDRILDSAFADFNEKIKLDLHGKVKIQVHDSRGPKRGARADYLCDLKTIRLSTKKQGSQESLAHELGHALDDKISNWKGVGKADRDEKAGNLWDRIVREYRKSPQGRKEREQKLQVSTRSGRRSGMKYLNWLTKDTEIFARCFETYIATKVPSWNTVWGKKVIDNESMKNITPLFDKLMALDEVKKAFKFILFGGSRGSGKVD